MLSLFWGLPDRLRALPRQSASGQLAGAVPVAAEPAQMQSGIPPPGPALPFDEWCLVLVNCLRELLPDVKATRTRGHVTIRRPGSPRIVTIAQDAGAYWIKTEDIAPMAMLVDSDRHDAHTARTFARSIAGGFEAKLARLG